MAHIFSTRRGKAKRDRWIRDNAQRHMFGCAMCGAVLASGRDLSRSAVVDHIIPASMHDPWDESNWWLICKRCHDTTCQNIEKRHGGNLDAIERDKLAWSSPSLEINPFSARQGGGKS